MGYSSRYHVASLAAVFVALAVGILIGAALGSDIVTGTADRLEEDLERDLDEIRARASELEADLEAERDLASDLYPGVVGGLLRGRRIALVGLGDLPDSSLDDVEATLGPSGARLAMVATVRESPELRGALDPRRAGQVLLTGRGPFDELRDALLLRFSGAPGRIDAAVIVRPVEEGDAAPKPFERGLLAGMRSAGATLAGAERSEAEPSSIPAFEDLGLASVDNVEELSGKVSLAFVLGGVEGSFGRKPTADALLPDLLAPPRGGRARDRG